MIYLIGGPPRCGKTTLAKRLAARFCIGWVSVDHLEGVVREYLPMRKQRRLFPKNVLRVKTGGMNDEMYARFSVQEIMRAYYNQGASCSKAIRSFVEACILEGHDFIIEGHQIHPRLAAALMEKFPEEIRSVFLIKQDERALVEGFEKNKAKRDWVLQKTKNQETFPKIAKMLLCFGARIEKEANKYGLPVYCMDVDFLKMLSVVERKMRIEAD